MDKELLSKEKKLYRESAGKMVDYFRENARALPWRNTGDPYKVWLSEIMLQQTRIEAVKGYFERFIAVLPTVEALADCPEELLMKLWEGLGYYSRARNLKKAAEIIVETGQFPRKASELAKLPGIGPYTSGAIASIAFGEKAVAVDGNVIRVLSRLCGRTLAKEEAAELLLAWFPEEGGASEYTQSWMELGETLCPPNGGAKCLFCPLAVQCRAYRENTIHLLPLLPEKKTRKEEKWTFFCWEYEGKIALRKRPGKGVLASMWEFPSREGDLTEKEICKFFTENHISAASGPEFLGKTKHIFTHIEWKMAFWKVSLKTLPQMPELFWVTPEELEEKIPLATAFRKLKEWILLSWKKRR